MRSQSVHNRRFKGKSAVHEPLKFAAADRVLELANGLGLDLAHTLAGDLEDPPDFFERVCVPVTDSIAELDDLSLAIGQRLEHHLDASPEHIARRRDGRGVL